MSKVFTITEGLENMGAIKTGGQGSIYKARRTGTIITAVKLLPTPIHTESLDDKNYIDFQNEVQKLKKVNEDPNPNVVKILSSGVSETGSFPFIEMEFIEGPDLEELLKEPHDPVFTIKETIKVAEHLSHALSHCHNTDIKHGDIKSNNVKYNIHTGNYVLLDFGLAIMSDEQRRTSLRHAGAIEFMAPEQSSGQMLFESDVYGFGVIMFELLAGNVPFPLHDKSETARNTVMVAHMETPPPDVVSLRRQNLPAIWPEDKREHEANIPSWLIEMIYKCLQKEPEKRFANGRELHEYILRNSVTADSGENNSTGQLAILKEENKKLREEKKELEQQLQHYKSANTEGAPVFAKRPVDNKKQSLNPLRVLAMVAGIMLAVLAIVWLTKRSGTNDTTTETSTAGNQYKVRSTKAYFHDEPDASTRRKAYLVPSAEIIKAEKEENGFIYIEFTNSRGQTSKGWIAKTDLVPLDEAGKTTGNKSDKLSISNVKLQLKNANRHMAKGETDEALYIYKYLSEQDVPEAMYRYGNLALKNQNTSIDCETAIDLITKANDKGYIHAKRTLGFLHLFANNKTRLQEEGYNRCDVKEDQELGSKLLMEAALDGDKLAQAFLDEFNASKPAEQ